MCDIIVTYHDKRLEALRTCEGGGEKTAVDNPGSSQWKKRKKNNSNRIHGTPPHNAEYNLLSV